MERTTTATPEEQRLRAEQAVPQAAPWTRHMLQTTVCVPLTPQGLRDHEENEEYLHWERATTRPIKAEELAAARLRAANTAGGTTLANQPSPAPRAGWVPARGVGVRILLVRPPGRDTESHHDIPRSMVGTLVFFGRRPPTESDYQTRPEAQNPHNPQ